MRFDPEYRLPAQLEYCRWRAATWPAGRHWRVRRIVGRGIDGVAKALFSLARMATSCGDFVHGQPAVDVRPNLAADGPRRINRYTEKTIVVPRQPFADADLEFLAGFTTRIPAALAALDDELRAAVLARQARGQQ